MKGISDRFGAANGTIGVAVDRARQAFTTLRRRLAGFTGARAQPRPRREQPASGRRINRKWLLIILCAAPSLFALVYYGLWAAPRYVSEAQFVVRGSNTARMSGLEALFRTFGIARAVDDANIVQQYMLSRDAVRSLDTDGFLKQIFSRPAGDVLARFPRFWESNSAEGLYEHYLWRVKVTQDANRGVLTLKAEGFQPDDARRLADSLMGMAEQIANRVNARALADAVGFAQKEVADAEGRLIAAQLALTQFRNAAVLVDPSKNSASTLETISRLTNELSVTLAEIQQIERTAPSNPGLAVSRARAEALRARISDERLGLAGDDNALATKVSSYERLSLIRDIADKGLASALLTLESARQEAQRKQIYIERISGPDTPEKALEPRRIRMIFTVLLVSLMTLAVVWILSVGAREHGQRPGA